MNSVVHIISGLEDGGAEGVLYRLCSYDEGLQHHVISMTSGGKYETLLQAQGVSVTCLHMPRGRLNLSGLKVLWRLLKTIKPDVVQTWMYHADFIGGLMAKLAGVPRIFWGIRHSDFNRHATSRTTVLVARICAFLSHYIPDGIICCAEKAKSVHIRLGYSAAKMHVVPNGYDVGIYQPDHDAGLRVRAEFNIAGHLPVMGFVARYDPQKDHATLLSALSILKERGESYSCLFVGTGMTATNTELTALRSTFGLEDSVLLLGRRADVPNVMNALDLHVMSSSFGEAFPNVLAEAMACGTPCITTDVGDAAAIVGTAGWVVQPRDPAALADGISVSLNVLSGDQGTKYRAAARARIVKHFSIERMVARYRGLWAVY